MENSTLSEKLNEVACKRYEIAFQCRNMEIELFWKRSSHYWVFVGAALVAYGALRKDYPTIGLLISCFGFISSVAWMLSSIGSKWWIENWEKKLKKEAAGIFADDLFDPVEEKEIINPNWFTPIIRYSVTRPTIALSEFTTLLWFGIFLKESSGRLPQLWSLIQSIWLYKESIVCAVTVFFIIGLFFFTRGKNRRPLTAKPPPPSQSPPPTPAGAPESGTAPPPCGS